MAPPAACHVGRGSAAVALPGGYKKSGSRCSCSDSLLN